MLEVKVENCAGIDVGKKFLAVCVLCGPVDRKRCTSEPAQGTWGQHRSERDATVGRTRGRRSRLTRGCTRRAAHMIRCCR